MGGEGSFMMARCYQARWWWGWGVGGVDVSALSALYIREQNMRILQCQHSLQTVLPLHRSTLYDIQ